MAVILIAAMSLNRVIGTGKDIPWCIPEEQQMFKRITTGHSLIMGRKTYESIGRPLPDRKNIVLSRNEKFCAEGCCVYADLDQAIADHMNDRLFVIGGAEIYQVTLPMAQEIYLTIVQKEFEGDVFFPEFDGNDFEIVERSYFEGEISFELIHLIKKSLIKK